MDTTTAPPSSVSEGSSQRQPAPPETAADGLPGAPASKLEVGIYQLADDATFKKNRTDGTGWDWSWADWRREWMDGTINKFAYRCLPLTIANQTGWWVYNPVGFTAVWNGRNDRGSIQFLFDTAAKEWGRWVDNQFGYGIITWNTPFLFRTKPAGSRLLVIGPANHFKPNCAPLTALIESDWISMSFTMNYKITTPGAAVRFEVGEPLFQAIPIGTNVCNDLEQSAVTYMKLAEDPEVHKSYTEWSDGRRTFHEKKARGEVKPDEWQKDYFKGKDASGQDAAPQHMTKVRPPKVEYRSGGGGNDQAPMTNK